MTTEATPDSLLARARAAAGLSGAELARRAHTSRPTLAAYEHGTKSPTVATAERILGAAGFALDLRPRPRFAPAGEHRGRLLQVPDVLPRLPLDRAVARVRLPLHLNWSDPERTFDLAVRAERLRAYEIVLREGGPSDVLAYVDGALLVDAWQDLVLPAEVRAAWAPVVARR